jgi:protein tyrosine phosphatase (PTP) superfamily phosphohydrolase (DUF442 family)
LTEPRRPNGLRWAIWPGLAVLLVVAALVAWNNGLRDRLFPRAFRVVEPGRIFASGQIYRGLIEQTLRDHHIQRLVSLTNEPGDPDAAAERQAADRLGVTCFRFPLKGDGTGDIHEYEKTLIEVNRAVADGAPILVHCSTGAQRTRGWIAFYRLLIQRRSPRQVAGELTDGSWKAPPNPNLFPYVNQHMEELARLLVADGVIDRVPDPIPRLEQ